MVCQNARVFFLYRIIFIVLSTSPVMYLFPKDPAQISDDSVNTLVKETMMGQSLMAEQERIRRFQRPPLRVRLLSDHQDLLYMMSVLTQYFSQYSSAVPVRLAAAWSELLTHSIGDAGLVRGGQNSLVTAINEVVVSVADATEAVAKAVRACMALLTQLSSYVGLAETRAAHRLTAHDRRSAYRTWREQGGDLNGFLKQAADLETVSVQPQSFSGKIIAGIVLSCLVLMGGVSALWYTAYHSDTSKKDKKIQPKFQQMVLYNALVTTNHLLWKGLQA